MFLIIYSLYFFNCACNVFDTKSLTNILSLGKQRRIKQARDEAAAEAEQYKLERERQFREYEAKYMGSREDILAKIEKETESQMVELENRVEKFKELVREIRCIIIGLQLFIHETIRKLPLILIIFLLSFLKKNR